MFREIFLAFVVSLDIFLAAAAYSAGKIRIPPASALIISLIGAAVLWAALQFSGLLSCLIPLEICENGALIILTAIGITSVFRSLIRSLIRRLSDSGCVSLKMSSLGLGISIYLDDTAADSDNSKTLSPKEAAALALASSLDSAAVGISCGFSGTKPAAAAVFTLIAGFGAILLGGAAGNRLSSLDRDLSWVGGVLLIIFAAVNCMI